MLYQGRNMSFKDPEIRHGAWWGINDSCWWPKFFIKTLEISSVSNKGKVCHYDNLGIWNFIKQIHLLLLLFIAQKIAPVYCLSQKKSFAIKIAGLIPILSGFDMHDPIMRHNLGSWFFCTQRSQKSHHLSV